MDVLKDFKERAASDLKTIVFAEGDDERIIKAAAAISAGKIAKIVVLGKKEEIYDYQYYALYGEIDFTLLKLTGGYTFKNREMYCEENKFDRNDGYIFSIQALYQF